MTKRAHAETRQVPQDGSLRNHVKELWEDSERLVRQEFRLAVVELDDRLDRTKSELAAASIGGAVLYAGVLALLGAAILLLNRVMADWVAALVVGGAAVLSGLLLLSRARHVKPGSVVPERAIRSVKQDARMLKEVTQ